jgi:hypothetical protein
MHCRYAVTGISLWLFLSLAVSAVAEEVWFAPPDNMDRGPHSYNKDFPHLFDPSPAWSMRADVFVLSPLFAEASTEEPAKRVTGFLKDHHIALAVGIGAVQMDNAQRTDGECGYGVEGYTRPNKNHIIFSRLKRWGLDIQYIAMDEPLSFGHHYQQGKACKFSIQEVAKRTAATVAEIRQIYPKVKFVDYEAAATAVPAKQWLNDVQVWLTAYRQAVGEAPDSMVFDVDWTKPWLEAVGPGTELLHRNGMRAGVFLDGTGPGKSDADAVAAYKKNMGSVDAARLPLDFVVIANWTPHPANDLPESDPNSLSGVLHYYMIRHRHAN